MLKVIKNTNDSKINNIYEILENVVFKTKVKKLVQSDSTRREYVLIVLENVNTKLFKVTGYSNYFFLTKLLNNRPNTKLNHAKVITLFLNYIFIVNSKKYNITDISDITIKMGDEFLKDYKDGIVGGNKRGFTKSRQTVCEYERILSKFYIYLIGKYKLKYISKKDICIYYSKSNKKNKKIEFKVEYPDYKYVNKVKSISVQCLVNLLIVTRDLYPDMVLAVAFQAFGGIRRGEVCSLKSDMIDFIQSYESFEWFTIDLSKDTVLRNDKANTGSIKSRGIQTINPIFLELLYPIYFYHKEKYQNKDNPFNPLFVNRNGDALTVASYNYRFKKIIKELRKRLCESENVVLASEGRELLNGVCGTHLLRYFYSQFLLKNGNVKTPSELAMWRRDKNINSAITYLRDSFYITRSIENVQRESIKEMFELENCDNKYGGN